MTTKKKPPAQVEPAQKAAALKAANEARRQAQPAWLRSKSLNPPREDKTQSTPELLRASDRSQGPPRLLDRPQVCAIANVSYPTLWEKMRRGEFPRGRVSGGKTFWISSEVEAWMASLPVRRLKGDE